VLILRLGAMGDVLHALPAVEMLRRSFPDLTIHWLVKPHWMPLLTGNPHIDQLIPYRRDSFRRLTELRSSLRSERYDIAIDLQGLIQSAVLAILSGAQHRIGYGRHAVRERLATYMYQTQVEPVARHIAERHMEVVEALGAKRSQVECWLPEGEEEGSLPDGPFVLACPFAGWTSKQWPLEYYEELAAMLKQEWGMPLILNIMEKEKPRVDSLRGVLAHCSSIRGLIHITRKATAVVGLDSGPLHLAAALDRPGVALFGPTDPMRNGPYPHRPSRLRVLRVPDAPTSYGREPEITSSMRALAPGMVFEALREVLHPTDERRSAQKGNL